ncbi:hypothetical protein F5972_19455 [Microbispora cellulosiformans]|uniref:Uncharacterized protein n=1 Tax=Microbispora cellulosiformans TaxID=2614688 RepID=A0A5J5K3F9_9ACTN|nr:hypothetical protein [Microbispora cellulosiformans]KAA9377769.1 hypothetical protein F5972_19455 [Microbispora cellulosiformans]
MTRRGALLLAAMLPLGACAAPATDAAPHGPAPGPARTATEPVNGTLDLSPLRQSGMDYDPVPSPEALAARRPIVAAGRVDGWQQGPALDSYPDGPLDYRVLMRVRITTALKGVRSAASIRDGVVFIEFDQGAVIRDDALPPEQWRLEKSVADFERAIPTGTRVLVFPRERPAYEQTVHAPGDPLPPGAKIMSIPPQGLVLEDPGLVRLGSERTLVGGREPLRGGSTAAWLEPRTMDEMIERLRRAGFSE